MKIGKFDDNYGIDSDWTKIVIHFFGGNNGNEFFNLPRVIWARKSWTLKELHLQFFNYFKGLLINWYKEIDEVKISRKCESNPPYSHPDSKALLTYQTIQELLKEPLEKLFSAFFPTLSEENWKEQLGDSKFSLDSKPYQLRI